MPRIPCMSMVPSSFASTDLSWMPRFCATAATPAVKQLARPTSTYSTGVAPRSSDAKTSGWSASNENSVLCFCSSPSPWKPCSFVWLCVPFCHLQDARHVNLAACGALFSVSRAASSASTLTPLLTIVSAIVTPLVTVKRSCTPLRASSGSYIGAMAGGTRKPRTPGAHRLQPAEDMIALMTTPASKTAVGSVGTVSTQFLDLPEPLALDCGRELHPIRIAYETYGTVSSARDNVILVCHALSGDAHAAGFTTTPAGESTRDGFRAEERDG